MEPQQPEHLRGELRRVRDERAPSSRARRKASSSRSERNFAIGERDLAVRVGRRGTRAPSPPTPSPSPRACRARCARARAARSGSGPPRRSRRRRTRSRASTSVASWISSPKRRSGLSEPNRSSASCHVIRGNGVSSSTPIDSRQIRGDDSLHQREDLLPVGERHLDVELRELLDAGRRADPRPGSSIAIW